MLYYLYWLLNVLIFICLQTCEVTGSARHSSAARKARNLRRARLRKQLLKKRVASNCILGGACREVLSPPAPTDPGMILATVFHAGIRPRDVRESACSREEPPPPAPADLGMAEASVLSAAARPKTAREACYQHLCTSGLMDSEGPARYSGEPVHGTVHKDRLTIEDLFGALPSVSCESEVQEGPRKDAIGELLGRVSDLGQILTDAKGSYDPMPSLAGRQRDPLPLPALSASQYKRLISPNSHNVDFDIALKWLNGNIFCINAMYGMGQVAEGSHLTNMQTEIIKRISGKMLRMFERLSRTSWEMSDEQAFLNITGQLDNSVAGSMAADAFDLLEHSACVDPTPLLDDESRALLSDSSRLFAHAPPGLNRFSGISGAQKAEYAKLVCRQLSSGKVALASKVHAGAGIFAVGKKESTKLREVWCGDRVSLAALRPPKPKHLASPSALLKLECTESSTFLVSKRDGRCLFDQLRAPRELQRWFGRPPLRVQDLVEAGFFTLSELQHHYIDKGRAELHDLVFPVSLVFPMGFSWSSFVAQSTMLQVCKSAGFAVDRVLADDAPAPKRVDCAFALATDDIMVFTRPGEQSTRKMLHNLDHAFARLGVQKHAAKDVSAVSDTTCVGIDVNSGRYLSPHAPALLKVLAAVTHMAHMGRNLLASPLQLAALMGVMQWECQLNRPIYSAFYHVYEFTKSQPDDVPQEMPSQVMQELLMFVFLSPCLEADLARPWLKEVLASDASPEYGFGVATYDCGEEFARSVGRLAVQPNLYVELDCDDLLTARRPKAGIPRNLGVHMNKFRPILSIKAKYKAHSGSLEAAGVTLMLRWLLRSTNKHAKRVAALIDAKAVLGAVCKGRSSAPTLRCEVRRIATLSLAGDWVMNYVYVPSAFNPADAPSRGKSLNRVARKKIKPVLLTAAEKAMRNWKKSLAKCMAYRMAIMIFGTIFSQRLGGLSFVGLLHENIFSSSLRHARLQIPLLRLCFTTLAFLGRVLLLFLWCFWLLLVYLSSDYELAGDREAFSSCCPCGLCCRVVCNPIALSLRLRWLQRQPVVRAIAMLFRALSLSKAFAGKWAG